MSKPRAVRSEEQFLCSICLQLFTDPVSTPCGHNFCKTCITQNWDMIVPCSCPMCKKSFNIRPELQVNTFISEMVSQFKEEAESISDQQVSKPGEVSCDVCTEPKLKALKSCLVCLASFCETHLEPHLTVSGLKRHQLMEPVENLEDKMCPKHDKPLELFCRTDQTCVCTICLLLEHKNHRAVPLKEESDQRKSSLQQTQAETQQMVDQRRMKIQEIRRSVELSQKAAESQSKKVAQVCSNIMESVQKCLEEFLIVMTERLTMTQNQAQDLVQELEQEISELKKRSTEVEQLSRSEDHLHFLQSSTSLKPAPALNNWSTVSFEPASFEGTAATALSELWKALTEEFKEITAKNEVRRVQQFTVDVSVEPHTANAVPVLSEDPTQAHHSDLERNLTDRAERDKSCQGLKDQSAVSTKAFHSALPKIQRIVSIKKKLSSVSKLKKLQDDPESAATALPKPKGHVSRKKEPSEKSELRRVQQFAVDVTLDPDTAYPFLVLSEDLKQVHCGSVEKVLPNNPERFSDCCDVLGKQSFSSGRFYFEVQVEGKTDWTLGVAQESITRKGEITLRPQHGFWTIWLRKSCEYKALTGPSIRLSLKCAPQKVGVFVDHDGGLVSFYDVDTADLIYSFTGCCFRDKLLPYFSPCLSHGGRNSRPLSITDVRVT